MPNVCDEKDWILLSDNRKEEILKSFEGYKGHNFVLKDIETFSGNEKYFYHNNLEKLNQLGLYIAYDPYMYEIIEAPCYVKGGDGGGVCHGGYYILGILPISPHYRDEEMIERTKLDGLFEGSVFVRRVLKI